MDPPVAPQSAKDLALLAGRKLLLADDSITIQKVVDLTFADEGVKVVCVGNGREAIEKLEEINPDVVLADVFMPEVNGYEVCEYIKHTEKLKHIPVMLLVGSFEPFDEAEARRVGADDTLTKPFQSIRKLIEKVGGLVGGQKAQDSAVPKTDEGPTAELRRTQEFSPEPERLSTAEIELTTADTQKLPDELESLDSETARVAALQNLTNQKSTGKQQMETSQAHSQEESATAGDSTDVLLDLGEFSTVDDAIDEEFVLDLDMNEPVEAESAALAYASSGRPAYVEPQIAETHASDWGEPEPQHAPSSDSQMSGTYSDTYSPVADIHAPTQEFERPDFSAEAKPVFERITDEPEEQSRDTNPVVAATAPAGKITLDQLAPEVIDAIARRAVEMLSEKVVAEIAWEVVPELSELMIRRQLEQKKN